MWGVVQSPHLLYFPVYCGTLVKMDVDKEKGHFPTAGKHAGNDHTSTNNSVIFTNAVAFRAIHYKVMVP